MRHIHCVCVRVYDVKRDFNKHTVKCVRAKRHNSRTQCTEHYNKRIVINRRAEAQIHVLFCLHCGNDDRILFDILDSLLLVHNLNYAFMFSQIQLMPSLVDCITN